MSSIFLLFCKIFGDFLFGGSFGCLVWEIYPEIFIADSVGRGKNVFIIADLDALDLPMFELGELPADKVGNLGFIKGSLEGAFGSFENLAKAGDVVEIGDFLDDGGQDLLLMFAAIKVAIFEGFAVARIGESAGAVEVDTAFLDITDSISVPLAVNFLFYLHI